MDKEYFQGEVLDLYRDDSKIERRTIRERLMMWACRIGIVLLLAVIFYPWGDSRADERSSHLVVATEKVSGKWRGTVMLAGFYRGGHAGVILNRPTKATMGALFPDHPPSAAVKHPLHFGGPAFDRSVVALIQADKAPHSHSIELAAGVWLVLDGATVDRIIAEQPNAARYFVGMVMWAPGELDQEVRDKMMVLRPVDKSLLFLPDTTGLHERLLPPKGSVES